MMQVLKEKNLIAERATLVEKNEEEEQVKEVIRVLEGEEGKKRRTLRIGSEGEEVKAMQVCSQIRISSLERRVFVCFWNRSSSHII